MKLMKTLRNGALALSAASAGIMPTAYALGDTENAIIKTIVDLVANMALIIGIVLLAWGVIMLVLAFKNEDADSKSRAIMLIAVSVLLIALKPTLSLILGAAGFTYSAT